MKTCVVIGGGIVGLSAAFYLAEAGHQVTLIEQNKTLQGTSMINAGYLTPSHIMPLASPGVVAKGFRWMFSPESPFYIKPKFDWSLMQWGYHFWKSSTTKQAKKAMPVLAEINLKSKWFYEQLNKHPNLKFHYESKGLLMAYQTEKARQAEAAVVGEAKLLGLDVVPLSSDEVHQLQPHIQMNVAGAFHYRCDAHCSPSQLMEKLLIYLKNHPNVTVKMGEAVVAFQKQGKQITAIETPNKTFKADAFVLSAGVWSSDLAKQLSLSIPMQAGKGYSINIPKIAGLDFPAILMESKVAVTPLAGITRFAGTMEISGIHQKVQRKRIAVMARAVEKYYPSIRIEEKYLDMAKAGLRPLSPDGLPFIGRSSKIENLIVATGHAMMGWSLGPVTGKMVQELVDHQPTQVDLNPFSVDRFA